MNIRTFLRSAAFDSGALMLYRALANRRQPNQLRRETVRQLSANWPLGKLGRKIRRRPDGAIAFPTGAPFAAGVSGEILTRNGRS